jgi:hypothetical protein
MRSQKLSNIYPFLVFGVPSFSYAGFGYDDVTFYEYDPDWSIDEKCSLTTCKSHFQDKERFEDHEATHKEQLQRMKANLKPFWKHIKVNTPELSDSKFFDFLNINIQPRFKSLVHKCLAPIADKFCQFMGIESST